MLGAVIWHRLTKTLAVEALRLGLPETHGGLG